MDIQKLNIHTLTAHQFEQMVEIEQNCGLEPYTRDMLLDCIENLDTYVCMDESTVAGFITILPYRRKLGGGLYIVNLNVANDYRRRGLAQKLILTACGAYLRSLRSCYVALDVAKTNTPAIRLYDKLGFALTDIPSQNGSSDVVMITKLDKLCGETEE